MSENKIEFGGIFSEGYGIIPKKLMKMKFDDKVGKQKGKNIKLVLSYMLSFTGAGKFDCFPSIESISNDLEISKPTVIEAINNAVNLGLISKEQMFPNDPLKHNNKYILKFMDIGGVNTVSKESLLTCENGLTFKVNTFEQNNNNINNNTNNNNSLFDSDESGLGKNNIIKEIIDYLNLKANRGYTYHNKSYNRHIRARLNDGFTADDMKSVIDFKSSDKFFIDNPQYMSPDTLFNPSKFEKYLNAIPQEEKQIQSLPEVETKNTYLEDFQNSQPDAQND